MGLRGSTAGRQIGCLTFRSIDEAAVMTHDPGTGDGATQRFEYFMVRVTRTPHQPERIAGLVERLGSGEKRSFDTGEQLLRLVGGGFPGNNMLGGTGHRNATES
jgi:hypothetical protein